MEQRDFTGASFFQYLNEKKLMASRCKKCQALYLPPRAICIKCYGDEMEWVETGGKGTLAAFTAINVAPTLMIEQGYGRDNPYCTGIVALEEGPKISAQLLGLDAGKPEEIEVGQPLTVDFVERGEGEEKKVHLAFKA
ncbi:MAG: Zn-ribbon domain-containing OB-fold protein [Chloroflexota bacterium]|nr:Zn-ribbon domain-containing OB-fold protein [Chloroflexota bacterium]